MKRKHAYLIMAHNDFEVLSEILKELDHERNDIYVHVDAKTGIYPKEILKESIVHGRIYFIPRTEVNWGGFSQIRCELNLMKQAILNGPYDYYHLSTGAIVPIKNQEEILSFFDEHKGYEFIGYDNKNEFGYRASLYNLFNEIGKPNTKSKMAKAYIRNKFKGLQKRLHYRYPASKGIEFKKGFVYWSLTEDAIKYILDRENWIEKVFKHSLCGDELFAQTLLFYSPFKEHIYDINDEYESCLRYVKPVQSWQPNFGASMDVTCMAENVICTEDIPKMVESNKLFGLKFVSEKGIEAIKELRKIKKGE